MRNSVVMMARGLALVGALIVAGACGDDGDGTVDPDVTEIVATVRADGTARSGVEVALYESGGSSSVAEATTSSNGRATFSDVSAGSYEVEVSVPSELELDDGEAARKPVTVATGQTATVEFDLVSPSNGEELTNVTLQAASFSPQEVTIPVGGTVRWTNGGAVIHTITPEGHSEWTAVTVSDEGETFSHTFDTEGEFPYLCTLHAGMTGTVTVE